MKLYRRIYEPESDRNVGEDETPVFLLHGLLGSGDNWHTIAQELSERRKTVVPDLRNHGRSPHSDEVGYSRMADDIRSLMDELKIPTTIIVGHSMGGKAGMELALSQPDCVEGLIVEDMIPGKTTPEYERFVDALRKIDVSSISSRREAEERLSKHVPDRTERLFLLKNLDRTNDGGFSWKPNLDGLAHRYQEIWAGLRFGRTYEGPSLFIRGGNSSTVADERISEIFHFFPNARVETIEDAGHWIHAMHPERFVTLVEAFIDVI